LPQTRPALALAAVLYAFRPLARFLLRHGVAYPAFAAALKRVFLEAARDELARTGQKQTDSAVSLLSGVHRRDVRELSALPPEAPVADDAPKSLASQLVARWLSDPTYLDADGLPLPLPRYGEAPSFDALAAATSSDIRARALLAELERLGIAQHTDSLVQLLAPGFVPRGDFEQTLKLMRENLHDHAAAATLNADGGHNYLEQSVFVDQITAESAQHLHAAAARVWRQAMRTVMREAQARYDHDRRHAPPAERVHRARFGVYCHAADDDDHPT
jgi:hypothetical protein